MDRYLLFACGILWATVPAAPAQQIQFQDVTEQAGLKEPLTGILGHAAAWGDYTGNGHVDLYVGGFSDRPRNAYWPAGGPVPNKLFRNLGDGRFEEDPQLSVNFFGRTTDALFADLDNNGWLELYVANNRRLRSTRSTQPQARAELRGSNLFRNDEGRLIDITRTSNACPPYFHSARTIGVLDYDGDGLLDLLIVEDPFFRNPRTILLRNTGNLRFRDVTREAGLPEDLYGLGLAIADINGNGRPDIFVAQSNRVFLSSPGGRYRESQRLNRQFQRQPLHGEDWTSGAHFADLNRNGLLDLVISVDSDSARNRVYLNQGLRDSIPWFRDVTRESGLPDFIPIKSTHVEIQDFDNDGWPDIYFSAARRYGDEIVPIIFRHVGVRNSIPRFEPTVPIKGDLVYYPGGPTADYDGDGRLDLFLVNWFRENHCRLLRNVSEPRSWIRVRAVGSISNRMGLGTKVTVYEAGRMHDRSALIGHQEISIGYGYASGQQARAHFGLDEREEVDVLLQFPSGRTVELERVKANQELQIEEPIY